MTGFIRPEVATALHRWREVIAALVVIGLGLWIALQPGPFVQGFGWVLIALGAIALLPAIRRARLSGAAHPGSGPGIVRVDEGRVLYMGPVTGGTVALPDLTHLSLRRDTGGRTAWVLVDPTALITVPTDAAGAEALMDALLTLDGLTPGRLHAALTDNAPGTTRLWVRSRTDAALPPA